MTAEQILSRLSGVRRSGSGWLARCPAHEDRNPSLSICQVNGKTLLNCHAGCDPQAVVEAVGLTLSDLFENSPKGNGPVAMYDYSDEAGKLLFQVCRFEPKTFRQRRPDGNGGWIWNMKGVRPVLYNLCQVMAAKSVLVCEGEKDCESAGGLDLTATTNAMGAGKWKPEYAASLKGKRVCVIADADAPGLAHAHDVARSLVGVAESVRLIEALPQTKDLTEWVEGGGTREGLLEIIKGTPALTATQVETWKARAEETSNPWARAETMRTFLADTDNDLAFLDPHTRIIARESITELFAPRGVGKSLFALWLAVQCSRRGLRVMVIDRDNPRSVVKQRLRSFGADPEISTLKAISREKCPPLTNADAWALFPYADHDVVILDSLDSAAEGVGEQDSAKPSRAIAPLLDIARRENGPAVLVLGNCVKTAAHSRGSGVIEDRADIVYEVRDATDFHPTGRKPWPEELPPADAGSWASRSSRRKQRATYRLAFIATKFRIAEEPEPFILEIDTRLEPWAVTEVTDDVDREGAAERERRANERAAQRAKAADELAVELLRRREAGEPDILKREAENFLVQLGLTHRAACEVLESPAIEIAPLPGPGHPKAVRLACMKGENVRNVTPLEAAKTEAGKGADFARPLFMPPCEIGPLESQNPCGSDKADISHSHPSYTPPQTGEKGAEKVPEPAGVTRQPKKVQWEA